MGTTAVGSLTYTYDAAGRSLQKTGSLATTGFPSPVASAVYDVANELTNWNGTPITYDANGNIQNDGVATYTWNGRNQLGSRGTASYGYDAYGRRTLNSLGASLLYQGANPVEELSGTTPVANRVVGGIDEFFSRTDSNGTYSPITDMLGSVLALTNSSGSISTQYSYDPFGNTTTSGSSSTNVYQYTGRENDGNSLYYYRARYYSPQLGRFISQDPLEFGGGDVNVYSYAGDSPTNSVDPSGTSLTPEHVGETMAGELLAGSSLWDALYAGLAVANYDNPWAGLGGYSRTQDTESVFANGHAMGGLNDDGTYQSCEEAYQGTVNSVLQHTLDSGFHNETFGHIHAIQDSYASGHLYQSWLGGLPSLQHFIGDLSFHWDAILATARYVDDLRHGRPIDPANYLAPDPCNKEKGRK